MTDWKLIIIVLIIAGITTLILIIGEVTPYLRATVVLIEDADAFEGDNAEQRHRDYYDVNVRHAVLLKRRKGLEPSFVISKFTCACMEPPRGHICLPTENE